MTTDDENGVLVVGAVSAWTDRRSVVLYFCFARQAGGRSHQPKHGILEQAAQDDLIPSALEVDWRCNLFV